MIRGDDMDKEIRVISTTEELKVISDPFRLQIINTYRRQDEPLTVKGCADMMHEVPAKVHYHVKKLLAVNVLVLDHIEIVNGINAKFYKLPNNSFKLALEDNDETMSTNLKYLTNVVISQLEGFKMDFIEVTQKAARDKEKNPHEIGWLSSSEIYLSEEEFDDVQTYIFNIIENKEKKDHKKKRYTFITGMSRKD